VPNEWPFLLSAVVDPVLGSTVRDDVALPAVVFQVEVPQTYDPAHNVVLRAFFYRTGPKDDRCFVFTVEASRLRTESGIEGYGKRRWVRVDLGDGGVLRPIDADAEVVGLFVVDLPVYGVPGLDYPHDLLPGDLLAFELAGLLEDGGAYHVLGVEFFESVDPASLTGGEVFYDQERVTCELIDCNGNGARDGLDIVTGISGDCNDNDIPDECDLCEATTHDAAGERSSWSAGGDKSADGKPFSFLIPGFTQALYATSSDFLGGIAFAADGDVLVNSCLFHGSPLYRFDAQTTELVHETPVHPHIATLPSNAGCGLTNHPNGTLYSNTALGVTNLDPETGDQLSIPDTSPGNGLGIATDPQTSNVVYVGRDGLMLFADATLTTFGVFSNALEGDMIQGITFDATGDYLFCANRTQQALTIINRSGEVVGMYPVFHDGASHAPVAVAVHLGEPGAEAAAPPRLVTLNVDGTMTRFDFPDGDYSREPTQSLFASGGFRGELSQVGPDGCLYVTQFGTRFADGTVSLSEAGLVRICGGFVPPAGVVPPIQLTPSVAIRPVRTSHTVTATLTNVGDAIPVEGLAIEFEVIAGPNAGKAAVGVTGVAGNAAFTYIGDGGEGVDQIQAWAETEPGMFWSNIATTTWVPLECSLDCNGNEIPDECELEGNDENGNEIPDDCESD
jgi:hypothetical protein